MLVLQLNPALVLPWYLASFCIITIVLYLPLGAEESGLECSMSWPPLPVMVASLVLACGIFFYVPPGLTMSRDIVTVIVKNEGKVPSAVTADYEIAPALGGYFPDATIDRFLVDAMPAAELADSLDSWRTRGPVAIRREDWSGIDTSETMTVGGRRIFRQNR